MIVQIDKYEFDTNTCIQCPESKKNYYQGILCDVCPIFVCQDIYNEPIINSNDYRIDWAKEFHDWIESGFMNEYFPELKFTITNNKKIES
jgi:hypothetical protein